MEKKAAHAAPSIQGPRRVDDVAWESWSQGSRFGSRVRRLSATASQVGVLIEELAPGKQSCPFHYHLLEEEHILGLEGEATLRLGSESFKISAGDFVSFPAGQKAGHALINQGALPFRFLVIGNRNYDDICIYPDSQKVFHRRTEAVYPIDGQVDYWQGEDQQPPERASEESG